MKFSFRGQNFRVANRNFLSLLPLYPDFYHARKVLSEIVDEFAALCAGDGYGAEGFVGADGSPIGGFQGGADFQTLGGGVRPRDFFGGNRRVENFPVVKFREAQRPFPRHLPRFVRSEHRFRSVRTDDAKLRQKCLSGRRDSVFATHYERPYRPAARDRRRQRVILFYLLRYVICLILQMGFIGGKPGRKIVLADLFSV